MTLSEPLKPSAQLEKLGICLPPVVAPIASYTPALVVGDTVLVSGQLPIVGGALLTSGRGAVGPGGTDPQAAARAARQCAINALAAAAAAVDGVDNLSRVVKVGGFVASRPGFYDQPAVINGASEFFHEVFASLHARLAVGVAALPLNASVEVEVTFEVR